MYRSISGPGGTWRVRRLWSPRVRRTGLDAIWRRRRERRRNRRDRGDLDDPGVVDAALQDVIDGASEPAVFSGGDSGGGGATGEWVMDTAPPQPVADGGGDWDWVPDIDIDDGLGSGLAIVAAVIVAAVVLWFALPLVLAAMELAIIVILVLMSLVGKVLFRRPWEIEVLTPDGRRLVRRIVGTRAAYRLARETSRRIERTARYEQSRVLPGRAAFGERRADGPGERRIGGGTRS